MVDEAEVLTSAPANLLAAEIQNWISLQYRSAGDQTPVSDYLYHVARKIQQIRELQLLPDASFLPFLSRVIEILVQLCPEVDRPGLINDLESLRETSSLQSGPLKVDQVSALRDATNVPTSSRTGRPATPRAGTESTASLTVDQMRRLELLLRRLETLPETTLAPTEGHLSGGELNFVAAEAIVSAASSSANAGELQELLSSMKVPGLPTAPEEILRVLARRLPDWAAPAQGESAPSTKTVEAVHKMVSLAETPQAAALRFRELVKTAADEFNQGSIGRAVTLLDLAQRMLDNNEVPVGSAAHVLDQGWILLAEDRLRDYTTDRGAHPLLQRVLRFFRDFSEEELLAELETSDERDRRRLILTLLQILGEPARDRALARLKESIKSGGTLPWYFERNLIYLLREIPRPEGQDIGPEIDTLILLAQPGCPYGTIREAVMTLGQIYDPRSSKALMATVTDLENNLLGNLDLHYDPKEVLSLLDRAVGALAVFPTREPRRRAVQHALAQKPQFGNAIIRIAPMAQQNLGEDPELVKQLIETVRSKLPLKVFGKTMSSARRSSLVSGILHILGGTDTPDVRKLLGHIVKGFPREPFAGVAQKILAALGGQGPSDEDLGATMSGDLELLSLPNLLQSLADAELTGCLTLMESGGRTKGELEFLKGKITAATTDHITGMDAVYHLLEKEEPNQFVFVRHNKNRDTGSPDESYPVLSLLLEGMRRIDEFRQAQALVPDDTQYMVTDRKPTRMTDEGDGAFLRELWQKASSGVPAIQCEKEFPVDAYRIRRCFEHWLQEGALTAKVQ